MASTKRDWSSSRAAATDKVLAALARRSRSARDQGFHLSAGGGQDSVERAAPVAGRERDDRRVERQNGGMKPAAIAGSRQRCEQSRAVADAVGSQQIFAVEARAIERSHKVVGPRRGLRPQCSTGWPNSRRRSRSRPTPERGCDREAFRASLPWESRRDSRWLHSANRRFTISFRSRSCLRFGKRRGRARFGVVDRGTTWGSRATE